MNKISATLARFIAEASGEQCGDTLPPAPPATGNPQLLRVSHFINANLVKKLGKLQYMKLLYKPAKLYTAGGDTSATWYVHFSWRADINSRFQRKRLTGDINRIAGRAERMEAGKILMRLVNTALETGYDPDAPLLPDLHADTNIIAAVSDVISVKAASLRPKTLGAYRTHTNRFFEWLKTKGMERANADALTPVHVNQHLDWLQKKMYHPRTINKAMSILGGIFRKLYKLKIVPENPFDSFDAVKEPESNFFELFTDSELSAIFQDLREHRPRLCLFASFIYYAYMRNASIRMIQRKDIDFEGRRMSVYGDNHKNGKTTIKQLVEPLYEALVDAGTPELEPDTYIFGTLLLPGMRPCGINVPARDWKSVVMKRLGINKKMYGLKHTGGSHYKLDNRHKEDLAWLQQQMGHSSLAETEAYVGKAGFVPVDENRVKFRRY